jgi:acyl dehydratase
LPADRKDELKDDQMSEATATQTTSGAPLVLRGLAGLQERLGTDLGVSSWRTVTQDDITTFAKLTGDEQWIHVDPERAKTGMFGRTIQHGFLTLGLATGFLWEVCTIDGFGVVLNYGIRMHVNLAEVKDLNGKGAEAVYRLTYEVEGETKPCCVADLVFRYYD